MRLSLLLLVSMLAYAQPPDPAYEPLSKAYQYLQAKQYDEAIEFFLKGIEAAPARPAIRKDLAYTYLKVGETEAARDQFAEAMRLDPADFHVALEYAFLCHETKMQAEARRVFDRIRKAGDPASRGHGGAGLSEYRPAAGGRNRALEEGAGTGAGKFHRALRAGRHWPSSATSWSWRRSTTARAWEMLPAASRRCSIWAASGRR